jgi:hypothetical protein
MTQLDTHSDSVHNGPAQRQHQHTDCICGHHTGLHENCNKEMILAIVL